MSKIDKVIIGKHCKELSEYNHNVYELKYPVMENTHVQ
jgi:hypothetical protein